MSQPAEPALEPIDEYLAASNDLRKLREEPALEAARRIANDGHIPEHLTVKVLARALLSADMSVKPCPFCGGSNIVDGADTATEWYVACDDCNAQVIAPTQAASLVAWNRREGQEGGKDG